MSANKLSVIFLHLLIFGCVSEHKKYAIDTI